MRLRWIVGAVVVGLALNRRTRAAGADMDRNWGTTPPELRALLLRVESVSRMPGAARFLAVVSWRESRWNPAAHNDSATEASRSSDAFAARRNRQPPLEHGPAAAVFGSGGLFGMLAPYFLWTGTAESKDRAPLLTMHPSAMFDPTISAFAAAVYLQRIVAGYAPAGWADVRAGWAAPKLLTGARGGEKYNEVRARFVADAATIGIDINDRATMPAPSARRWPGVAKVYQALVSEARA